MPMYEYHCGVCAHDFEALVMPGETAECPKCNGTRLERLLSVPGAPQVKSGGSMPMACQSQGPPCGPACSRFEG
jgi:putative FmdB family regulatory protein